MRPNAMDILDFYTQAGSITRINLVPDDVALAAVDTGSTVALIQGLLIHEALTSAYGASTPEARTIEKQLHGADAMLERAKRLDTRPLSVAREPSARVVGVCRHFATLLVAILRARGVPARVRCGFATYFMPGRYVDHWVAECWSSGEQRWVLVDAQIDDVQRSMFGISFDTLDVPRDLFLVAGDAWRLCRSGADPLTFGVSGTSAWGLVEVFGNVFQDIAALQKIELLPWGWYGLAASDEGAAFSQTELIDRLAAISSAANAAAISELLELVARDDRVRVPSARLDEIGAADVAICTVV